MINPFDIAKAFRDHSKSIADANGYTLVGEGEPYEPDVNTQYIDESLIFGPDNPVGISDNSNDFQLGIYQLMVNTPKAFGAGAKWKGLEVVGVLKSAFPKGLELTSGGQKVRIKSFNTPEQLEDETYINHVLSLTYSVIN